MKANTNPNWLCGRPLVFGDVEQIAELNKLNKEYDLREKLYEVSPCTTVCCPECNEEFDVADQLTLID